MGMQDPSPLFNVLLKLLPDADEAELSEDFLLLGHLGKGRGVGILCVEIGCKGVDP